MEPFRPSGLFSVEIGEGSDVAVMLHGGPGASHDYLRPQLDALAAPGVRRLFYYDQRGGVRSPLPEGRKPLTAAEHVADLELIRQGLGQERLTLVGYSWGGLLAMLYAIAHPERVAKLVLVSPATARGADRAEAKARLIALSQRPIVDELRREWDPKDRRVRFALAVAGYFVDPRRALELTPFLVKQSAEEAVWSSLGDYDLLPLLAALDLRAIVVHGEEDPIPIATARATAAALRAEMIAIPRCGHVPYVEAPDGLFPPLRRFLDGR